MAFLWKMICNLGVPMSLRHPVTCRVNIFFEDVTSYFTGIVWKYTCRSSGKVRFFFCGKWGYFTTWFADFLRNCCADIYGMLVSFSRNGCLAGTCATHAGKYVIRRYRAKRYNVGFFFGITGVLAENPVLQHDSQAFRNIVRNFFQCRCFLLEI